MGFSNASPFFSGVTEHCSEGRIVRANTHVPAHSYEITPSRRGTLRVLCCWQCVSVSALAQGAGVTLFVTHLKSVAWPFSYTRNTQNTIGTCSRFKHPANPMIRLQLGEAVSFWHWKGFNSVHRSGLCGLYTGLFFNDNTVLFFNDNAMTQRFLNSS